MDDEPPKNSILTSCRRRGGSFSSAFGGRDDSGGAPGPLLFRQDRARKTCPPCRQYSDPRPLSLGRVGWAAWAFAGATTRKFQPLATVLRSVWTSDGRRPLVARGYAVKALLVRYQERPHCHPSPPPVGRSIGCRNAWLRPAIGRHTPDITKRDTPGGAPLVEMRCQWLLVNALCRRAARSPAAGMSLTQ